MALSYKNSLQQILEAEKKSQDDIDRAINDK